MGSVEESGARARLGRILTWIGLFWGGLFFAAGFLNAGGTPLGDILAFFGGSIWIPAALIFIGRGLRRSAAREDEEVEDEARPATMSTPPILPGQERRQAPPPPPEPRPRPQPRPAEPMPKVESKPRVEPTPRVESKPKVDPVPMPASELLIESGDFEPTYKAKSSEEMIAEAKKRLARDS